VSSRLYAKVLNPFQFKNTSQTSYILGLADSRGSEYIIRKKGAIMLWKHPLDHKGFYSTLFLVPKKEGQMKPIINPKRLNKWVVPQHFELEGKGILKEQLRANNWLVKVDPTSHFQCTETNI